MTDLVEITKQLILRERVDALYGMANIHPKESHIRATLYSTYNGKDTYKMHGPRVKVELRDKSWFPILLNPVEPYNKYKKYDKLKSEDKSLVDEALEYIKKYEDVFLAHWNEEIIDYQLHLILDSKLSLEDALKENE